MKSLVSFFIVVLVTSCLSTNQPDDPSEAGVFVARWPGGQWSVGDRTRCLIVDLGNPIRITARTLRVSFSGAAHVIVSHEPATSQPTQAPTTCAPLADRSPPLLVAQHSGETLELPEGVGIVLDPHALLRIEVRDDLSDQPQLATVEVDAATDGVPLGKAGIVRLAIPAFALPPNAVTVVDNFAVMPSAPSGASYFAFAGQTHHLGVGVRVAMATDKTGDRTPVYLPTSFDWSAPPLSALPPSQLPDGGGFYLQCTYYNNTTSEVRSGVGDQDEICAAWGYYYPASDDEVECFGCEDDTMLQPSLMRLPTRGN